jgi:DNA-binding response OmpR family regulator
MPPVPKILVVEDDDAIRALLVAALRREPFDVHAAVNGADALNMTRATEYTVILLDLMMPMLNGIEFLEAFHEAAPQSRTVIFIMTAGDDTAVRRLPPNVVHGIVRKPFDVPQLVAMVRAVADTPVAPAPEPGATAEEPAKGDEAQPDDPAN